MIDINPHFNSIKVQLELAPAIIAGAGSMLFQFHKGTIRTLLPCFVQELNPFQFHKGTIRTQF